MKKLIIFTLMFLFLFSYVSADLSINPFAERKIHEAFLREDTPEFITEGFNNKYGSIKLSKTFLWIETDKIAEYSLVENTEQCLINCEAKGKAVLYSSGKLFDDLNFIDKKGINVDVNAKYLIKQIETYQVEVPNTYKEFCEKVVSNETKDLLLKEESSCYQVVDTYKNETRENEVWTEYNGEELKAGEYEWKIQGTKSPSKSVDFIPTARGKALNEWAWWNGDWGFKRQINVTENSGSSLSNYSTLIYVSYRANMKTDFSDLRFLNSAEDTELNYWVENKTDSSFAYVWVKIPTLTASSVTSIYMYYGNSEAISNSNINQGFLFGDDFSSGSLNSSLWDSTTGSGGSISVSGGQLTITHTSKTNVFSKITSKTTYGTNTEIISKFNTGTLATGTKMKIGYSNYMNWETRDSASRGEFGSFDTNERIVYYNDGGTTSYDDAISFSATSSLIRKIQRLSNSKLEFLNNGISLINKTTEIPLNSYPLEIQVQKWGSSNATINVDWVLIRNLASSEPTYTIEDENGDVIINLISPIDYYNSSNQTIDFSANLTDEWDLGIANVSLVINDTIYDTNTSGLTGVYNFSETLSDGFYEWYVEAYDDTDNLYESETRYFTIDTVEPEIEILSPVTSYDYLQQNQTIDLNVTVTDEHLDSCWYKYPNESYEIYSNYFSPPFENVIIDTYSYIIAKLTPGSIFQPTITYELGYCNNVSFSTIGFFLYLRCNDAEPSSSIVVSTGNDGRNVTLYGYNLTSFNCSENQTFNYIPDQNSLTIYANDTLGNEGSESVSWDYKVLELSRNYNANVYETGREEYEINLKSNDSLTNIKILYDSMEIILSKINDTLWRGSQNIFTSLIGTNDIIFEFNYSGETFQSYVSNQTVYELNYGFNPTYTNSLNITIRDEETNDIINDTTLYYNNIAWIGNGEVTKQFTESSLEDGEYMIGFSPSTILELNTNNHFWVDAPGYQLRNYYFEDITLYNDSVQNYTFYLLDSISGLVTRYKIVSPISGNAIEDVKVTSYKESVPKILTEIAMTDATGVATMWQNADYFYEMTFEKEGCDTKVSKIRPSTSDIQIIEMNCKGDLPEELTDEPWAFPEDQKDFRISFTPNTQILYEDLNNFTGYVKDKDCELGDVVFNIKDENDTILNTTSFNNTCINDLNLTYNTTGVKTITLELIVEKDDVTYIFDKVFQIIGSTQLSEIPNLWDVIMMMPDYDELGFSTSTRFFLGLIILFLLLSYLSTIEGFKSEGIGTLIFIPFYVLILSVLGWFSLPVTSFTLINKYGLFIITLITVGGVLAIKTNN